MTAKQVQVLDLLIRHQTTKDIARSLQLAPSTVDQRIAAVGDKWETSGRKATARLYAEALDVRDRSAAVEVEAVPSGAAAPAAWPGGLGERHPVEPTLLAWLDRNFGMFGRVLLIVLIALVLAMLLVTSLGVADSLARLLES